MPLFTDNNKIDTVFLCKESKDYLNSNYKKGQNTFPKIFDLKSIPDNELGLKTLSILEELNRIEGENVSKLKGRAKIAKNKLIKSILGLSGLSVVLLTLVSVALFVPTVTAMATTAIAAILATGPFALSLLITAGIILSGLTIVPSLIFAWKKYKSNRAHNKSMSIVTELTSKLDQLNSYNDKEDTNNVYGSLISQNNITSNSSYNDNFSDDSDIKITPDTPVNYANLATQLKNALEWRVATLKKDPVADAS